MRLSNGLTTGTRLRIAVAVVVVLVNVVHQSALAVLPWALLVVAADLAAGFALTRAPFLARDRRRAAFALTLTGAMLSGLALSAGPGALPLVIVPVFRAGEYGGRRYVLTCGPVYLVAATVAWIAEPSVRAALDVSTVLIWGALALSLGVLAAWSARLSGAPTTNAAAGEATWLLARLDDLASDLRGGFDPATSAEHLLDALPPFGSQSRASVLIGSPTDRPVPLALRGSLRVPWPDPLTDDGVLGLGWREGRIGSERDEGTRRNLVVAPLDDSTGKRIGMVVRDWLAEGPALANQVTQVAEVTVMRGGIVGVALAFGQLRERAGLEERERLARQIHDGIAQELVAFGFRLDRLKRMSSEPAVTAEVHVLRGEVSRILGDVRSHIGDLRLTVRPEGGLGAAVTAQLQSFGAATGAVVGLRLSESTFRLPADVETGLYRIFLDFLADARRSGDVTSVDVELTSQAPDATLVMRHGSSSSLSEVDLARHLPGSLDPLISITQTPGGPQVAVHLMAVPDKGIAVLLDERLPAPS